MIPILSFPSDPENSFQLHLPDLREVLQEQADSQDAHPAAPPREQ